jgi:hypothetical protein
MNQTLFSISIFQAEQLLKTMNYKICACLGLAGFLAGGTVLGAAFVQNPSFESNYNETWPHYSSIDDWMGGSGVNQAGGPFHNSGTPIPDREQVGFQQGEGEVSQEIWGLEAGGTYWLQFFYDGRVGGGASQSLVVLFDETEIGANPNIRPSTGDYYFMNAPFTAESEIGTIRFLHSVSGDRTLLLDGVSIIARPPGDVVVRNPSFEASGILPHVGQLEAIAGWEIEGFVGVDDGTGGYADNGQIPDQALAAFLMGPASLSQRLTGLIPGNDYEIRLEANAGAGSAPQMEVLADGAVVIESNVTPGGYQVLTGTFQAAAATVDLVIAQTQDGFDVLLVDDVRVIGETEAPLPPMVFEPLASEVSPGQVVQQTLTLPVEAVARGPVQIRIASSTPSVGRLAGAGADGSLTLNFDAENLSRTFSIETLGRGSATVNVLDDPPIPFPATPVVNVVGSLVKNASFEGNPAGAFPGYGSILAWEGSPGSGLNRAGSPTAPAEPFGDNGVVPDREQVAFIQGDGFLSQEITGLTPGEHYWLQFHYNARNCCGERSHKLIVRFAGQELAEFPDLIPVSDWGEVDYYAAHLPFTAEADSGLLEFIHEVAEGDASVVLDAVNIVPRSPDDIPILNPSFEASGSPPGVGYLQPLRMAGWEGGPGGRGINVDGAGPFTDNGAVPDQDRAAFLQNVGSYLSQDLSGFTAGEPYTLVVALNARNCCVGFPTVTVSMDGIALLEEEISPVGGWAPYHAYYLPFTPFSSFAHLRFEVTGPAGGDVSLLLDDVRIVPGERSAPFFTAHPFDVWINAGEAIELTGAASGSNLTYSWRRDGVQLEDGGRVSGATTPALRISDALPSDAGNYRLLVSDGLGILGSEIAEVLVEGGLEAPSLQASLVAGGIQLRWPAEAAGFQLQRTGSFPGNWQVVDQEAVIEGNDYIVILPLEDEMSFFQLAQ